MSKFPIQLGDASRHSYSLMRMLGPPYQEFDPVSQSLYPLRLNLWGPTEITRNPISNGYRNPSAYGTYTIGNTAGLLQVDFPLSKHKFWAAGWRQWMELETYGSTGTLIGYPTTPNLVQENAVWMKVRNAIKDETLDVGMVLAEMQGTVDTISTGLQRIGRSLTNFKRKRPGHFHFLMTGRYPGKQRPTDRRLRATAGYYLEWKYGIMPTVLDVVGGVNTLDEISKGTFFGRAPIMTARARDVGETELSVPVAAHIERDQFQGTAKISISDETYCRADYTVEVDKLRGLSRFGIGLSTLPTVLFERTPFSFVLNMAIPIADIIKAWGALAGVSLRGVSITRARTVQVLRIDGQGRLEGYSDWGDRPVKPNVVVGKVTTFSRTAPNPPRIPLPMPYVRNPIKTGNLATVLALFTSLRK